MKIIELLHVECWNVTGEMLKCCRENVEMPWPKCWFIWSKLLYGFTIEQYDTVIKVV